MDSSMTSVCIYASVAIALDKPGSLSMQLRSDSLFLRSVLCELLKMRTCPASHVIDLTCGFGQSLDAAHGSIRNHHRACF